MFPRCNHCLILVSCDNQLDSTTCHRANRRLSTREDNSCNCPTSMCNVWEKLSDSWNQIESTSLLSYSCTSSYSNCRQRPTNICCTQWTSKWFQWRRTRKHFIRQLSSNDESIHRMENPSVETSEWIDTKKYHLHRINSRGAPTSQLSTKDIRRHRSTKWNRKIN
jgi:hypothetical protein